MTVKCCRYLCAISELSDSNWLMEEHQNSIATMKEKGERIMYSSIWCNNGTLIANLERIMFIIHNKKKYKKKRYLK